MKKLLTVISVVAFAGGVFSSVSCDFDNMIKNSNIEKQESNKHWTIEDLSKKSAKWATEIEIEHSDKQREITIDTIIFEYLDTTLNHWEYTARIKGHSESLFSNGERQDFNFRIIAKESWGGDIEFDEHDINRNI